jgi:hypothetical protein
MNKLKLHLDDLRVDTFDTTPVQKERGTVVGEQCTCPTQCTCPGCPTCDHTCQGDSCEGDSCFYGTCAETCANYPYAQPCTQGKPIACWE